MKPNAHRHERALAGLLLATAVLLGPSASAVPITATVHLTNGSLGPIDLTDSSTSATDSVRAGATSTTTGAQTGITLGEGMAEGTVGGLFSVGISGQDTHAHEASFQFIETISNTTALSQLMTLDFVIDAGRLSTIVREIPPGPGGFLEAGYDIEISFEGISLFQSGARLRQVGVGEFDSDASVTQTGTSLNGVLTDVESYADEFLFSWDAYAGSLDLGILGAGASGVLQYDVRAFVAAEGDRFGGTFASIGDPFNVSGSPMDRSPFELSLTQPSVSVPEPGSLALLATGLLGFVLLRRRSVA